MEENFLSAYSEGAGPLYRAGQLFAFSMTQSTLCIHVDGSRVQAKGQCRYAIGWAVVGTLNGELIERCGSHPLTHRQLLDVGHLYEQVAFISGVLLARNLGVPFSQLTLLCDDEIFGYAPTWLHPENYQALRKHQVATRLQRAVDNFFAPEAQALVLQAFEEARIVKLKGHRGEVYQERADYLAKHNGRLQLGVLSEAALSFDEWLDKGLIRYISPDVPPETWYAPFVRSL